MREARLLRRPLGLAVAVAAVVSVLLSLGQATAFPGANGRIAFTSDRDGDFDVYTMTSSGTDVIQVTNEAGDDIEPSYSPDGTLLVYSHAGDIYVINAGGPPGSGTALTSGADYDDEPTWSHDGSQIAFTRRAAALAPGDIWKMNSDGSGPTQLTSDPADDGSPNWSPDGDKIVFETNREGQYEIFSMTTGGDSEVDVSNDNGADDTDPFYAPDGDAITFIRTGDVYRMAEDGASQVRLTNTSAIETHPTWSPSGAQIAFARDNDDDIYVIPAGGGAATALTTESAEDRQPDWGVVLAFTSKPQISEGGVVPPPAPLEDGTTLTAVPTAPVNNNPAATVTNSFQWMRCDTAGENCSDISGATGESYTIQSADIGQRIRVRQIATSSDGTASAISDPTPVVVAAPPDNILKPTISPTGAVTVGQTLTVSNGTWQGSQPMTFAVQWRSCTSTDVASCTDIPSATGTTYILRSEDLGKYIRVKVTGTNSLGSDSEHSEPTEQVATAAPVNIVPPTITGTMRVGTFASVTAGTWQGVTPMTFTYRWQRCNPDGSGCVDIPGATSASYTIVAADAGKKLQVVVRASNSAGFGTISVLAADVVTSTPPVNSFRPSISGLARVGSVLSATTGTWTGTLPITYTYQWLRCDADGENCVNITGATAATYIPTAADVGRTILVRVTATNTGGSASADSNETAVVTSTTGTGTLTRPANTSVPRITGTPAKNSLLVATPGIWTGTTPMTFSYQWQNCTTTTLCSNILRATLSTYRPTQTDVGKRLRVVVTAGNAAGSATANSAVTAVVKASGPVSNVGITRRGTAKNDRLFGTARNDVLIGRAGNDQLFGRAGNDRLQGDAGADRLTGEAGNDRLFGGLGNDILHGGTGNDTLSGNAGNDTLNGGPGKDNLRGNAGNDTFQVRDGAVDRVNCGPGRDIVIADRNDIVNGNCERVSRTPLKKSAAKKTSSATPAPKSSPSRSSSALVSAVNAAISWAGGKK